MSEEVLTSPGLAESSPPMPDSVSQAIEGFQGIRSRALRWVVWLLPCVILLWVVLARPGYMLLSGLVAAAVDLIFFWNLMQRIPETLGTLWHRDLIEPAFATALDHARPAEGAPDSTANPPSRAPLEDQYRTFIRGVEDCLNHPGQLLMGVFCALVGGGWPFLPPARQLLLSQYGLAELLLFCIPVAFIGFIVGLMAWRMVVIGMRVWQLGKRFDLIPDVGRPGRCGGLEPLGNLCLWNALILTIPGVYLGGWIILGPRFGYWAFYGEFYFPRLLWVVVGLATISFFLPLWSVHQEMVAQRAVVRRQLHLLGQSINHLARVMLDQVDELKPKEGKELAGKLELMRQIYQQNEHYPVWPFNVTMLVQFVSAQAVPVVGLMKLSEPTGNAIGKLLESLGKLLAP